MSTCRPALIVAFSTINALVPRGIVRAALTASSLSLLLTTLEGMLDFTFESTVVVVDCTLLVFLLPGSLLGSLNLSSMIEFFDFPASPSA